MGQAGDISTEQYRALLACVRELTRVAEVEDFHTHAVRATRGLLDDAWVSSEAYEPATMAYLSGTVWPLPPVELYELFQSRASENPMLAAIQRGAGHVAGGRYGPLTWPLVLGASRSHDELPIYHDLYVKVDINNQAAFWSYEPDGRILSHGFSRDGAYRESELEVLRLLAPHLSAAYRSWQALAETRREPAWLEDGLEAMGSGLMLLDAAGKVRRWTPRAGVLLERYFSGVRRERGRLPRALERWVAEAVSSGPEAFVPPGAMAVAGEGGGSLRVGLTWAPRQAGYLLILEEQRTRPSAAELGRRFGLPPRRAEVLALLAEGKSNASIAASLGLSARTVGKHLELIYRDLEVEGRTAAAAKANEAG